MSARILILFAENDLVPRRLCCVESQSEDFCDLYREMRPAANCEGYVQRWPSMNMAECDCTQKNTNLLKLRVLPIALFVNF